MYSKYCDGKFIILGPVDSNRFYLLVLQKCASLNKMKQMNQQEKSLIF